MWMYSSLSLYDPYRELNENLGSFSSDSHVSRVDSFV